MQKSISIKALSILLSILLVVTLCPLSALANESSDEIEKTVETQEHAQDQIEPTQGSGLEDNNAKIESTTEVDDEKKSLSISADELAVNENSDNLNSDSLTAKAAKNGSSLAPVISEIGSGFVTLSWEAVPNATKYAVSECMTNGQYVVLNDDITTTSYSISDLSNETTHYFLVQAYIDGKWSSYTDDDLIYATPEGPTKPAPEVTGVDNSSISLSWNAVPGATKYAVSTKNADGSYNIRATNVAGTSYTLAGLTNALEYSVLVQAYIDGKWSSYTDDDLVKATPISTQQPAPSVESVGLGSVTLSWQAVPNATKYAVSTKNANGTYNIRTTDVPSTSYTLENLMGGQEYLILVQAFVNGRWTTYTDANLISATPEGPTKPAPEVTGVDNSSISLSWNAVPGATKYAVSTKNADGSYNIRATNVAGTSYTLAGLTNALEYSVLVQAYIDGKWSSYTDDDLVKATPADSFAPSPWVESIGNGTATIAWEAIPGATKYAVARYVDGSYTIFTTDCTDTSYYLDDLGNGYDNYILVQAYVDGAWSSDSESYRIVVHPNGPTRKPAASASAGTEQVTLTWTKVPGATRYAVSYKTSSSGFTTVTTTCKSLSYTVTGLTGGQRYQFLVQAYVCGNWSSYVDSDLVSATPKESPLKAEQRAMLSKINGYSSNTQWLIAVDRSTHRVGVFKGSRNNWSLQYYWSCVTGAPSTPTIMGSYLTTGFKRTALTTDSRAIWCTQIYGGYFFHSILASESELGQSLSHGCIRLPYSAAQWIYNNIFVGTRVVIYN